LAFVLFALVSAAAFAQNPPEISKKSPALASEAPFLLPDEPGAVAPVWLTLDCTQFDHGFCHYIPAPTAPDCCIASPPRVGCFNVCTDPPIE
jgi:hypothetical protein